MLEIKLLKLNAYTLYLNGLLGTFICLIAIQK